MFTILTGLYDSTIFKWRFSLVFLMQNYIVMPQYSNENIQLH